MKTNVIINIHDILCWNYLQKSDIQCDNCDLSKSIDIKTELLNAVKPMNDEQTELGRNMLTEHFHLYNGSQFMKYNESKLINDKIVTYAYYTFVISHIINALSNYQPFQFCISFIAKDIISTKGNHVSVPEFLNNSNQLKTLQNKLFNGNNLIEDIKIMS
eukprot:137745_1